VINLEIYKNESSSLNFKKQNCNSFFIHPNLLILSKTSFYNVALLLPQRKTYLGFRAIDLFGTN